MFLGILAYMFIIPILEACTAYICQWLEVQRSRLLVKQAGYKKEIAKLEEDDQQTVTRVIGFQTSPEEEEYEEDEDQDD